ncbi:hypothetical protein ACIQGZ_18910 [Streptomyces sp. NPDC092296]|uniref:hypothetical protein n=1 Tax=Streptomyces sp. NPDC092296 TaxID=3366012 RepID=UPI0037FA3011
MAEVTSHARSGGSAPAELWSFRVDVAVEYDRPARSVLVRGPWGDQELPEPGPVVREVLRRMELGPISLQNALGRPGEAGAASPADRARVAAVLERLQDVVVRSPTVPDTGQPMLSVVPTAPAAALRLGAPATGGRVQLVGRTSLRRADGELLLEAPGLSYQVVLHRAEALELVRVLRRPIRPESARCCAGGGPALVYLLAAGLVVPVTEGC